MTDEEIDPQKVARRLRAIMAALDMETVGEFADFLEAERSQVSNWLQGYHLPPPRWLNILCRKQPGLKLDWIYRGDADALPMKLAILLEALVAGMDVPLVEPRAPAKRAARRECREAALPAFQTAKSGKPAT